MTVKLSKSHDSSEVKSNCQKRTTNTIESKKCVAFFIVFIIYVTKIKRAHAVETFVRAADVLVEGSMFYMPTEKGSCHGNLD